MDASHKFDDYSLAPDSASMVVNVNKPLSSRVDVSASEESRTLIVRKDRSLAETLFDNRAALKIITSRYGASHIDPTVRSQLFFQIDWLLNSQEWEEGDHFADAESFKSLIRFILNSGLLRPPSLGLSDGGNLLASWINGDDRLVLECLPNDRFKWLVSCVYDGEKERVAGESPSLLRLLNSLEPYKNAGWLKP